MTLRDFPGHEVRKLLKGHRPQIPLVPVADGDGAVFRLPLAEHQHVGNAVQAGVADFGADFIRRFVHRDAHSPGGQGGAMRGGHVRHLVGDGQHAHLFRRKPGGEFPFKVFNQKPREAFHGAEGGAVHHHGPVRLVVRSGVMEVKAFRQVVVHLHGAQLPFAADGVAHDEVNLGAVEGGFPSFLAVVRPQPFRGFPQGLFRFVPAFPGNPRICRFPGRAWKGARGSQSCPACRK